MIKHGFMHEIANLLENNKNTYLLLIDVIDFIKFNEDYGFRVGDFALHEAVKRISEGANENMTIFTLAGDEWILFSQFEDYDKVEEFAQNILQNNERTMKYKGFNVKLQLRVAVVNTDYIDHRNAVFAMRDLDSCMNKLKKISDNYLYLN